MLTIQLLMFLALLGTALMAIVIFAPAPAVAKATAPFASPLALEPPERWDAGVGSFTARQDEAVPVWSAMTGALPLEAAPYPAWPALLHASAAHCDAAARLELVAALATVRTPWSDDVLRCALAEEYDPHVRDAIGAALTS